VGRDRRRVHTLSKLDISPHTTKTALKELLPYAEITGGSFVNELPKLSCLSDTEARLKLKEAREEAVIEAMHNLKAKLEHCQQSSPKKAPAGYRIWPDGYTGSVTHKGPIVLSAVVETNRSKSLGIDVEFNHANNNELQHVMDEEEMPSYADAKPVELGVFSTKESVYKSYFPVVKDNLTFDDVCIDWVDTSPSVDYGIAKCPNSLEIKVQCRYAENWVISTAQLKDTN